MDRLGKVVLDPGRCRAAIFDMDGVVTDTADLHARAWQEAFDAFLARRAGRRRPPEPFRLPGDYRRHVDGKARIDGVRDFLASRGIELDPGSPDDPPEAETARGLGNLKNEIFLERLRRQGADPYQDAVALIRRLQARGMRVAVISASRNAAEVLKSAGVADLFEARVDGREARREGLAGKPAPDVFSHAARKLEQPPQRCAVLEDARAGVAAGRAGGFRPVIGVARSGSAEERESLAAAGADAVVATLDDVRLGSAREPA